MQVNDSLLSKLEKLSFLKVSENKRKEIINQLSEIFNFVNNLSELNTINVNDNFAMNDSATILREDIPFCNQEINKDILKHAPLSGDNFFIVPKIIE